MKTRQKLLEECDVQCIVSLAPGVFTSAGAGIKTNVLFFRKGSPTKTIWYYEVFPSERARFTKTDPLTLEHFDEFFSLIGRRGRRADSARSWTVSIDEIKDRDYELTAVNPHRKIDADSRTAEELLAEIEMQNAELKKALRELRGALKRPRGR